MITRRLVLASLLAGAPLPLTGVLRARAAETYPARPIKMIAPFTPGSPVDVVARLLAQHLSTQLGQNVVVENRPGAGTTIGMKVATAAEPDGYTLLFQSSSLVVAPAMYRHLDFDPVKSFAPVANVAWGSWVTVVPPSLPVHTPQELIAYAKAHPGKLNFGSSGAGSAPHLAAELFSSMAGIKMVHVPYKGSGESQRATLAGDVDLTFFAFSTALRHAKAGKLRALGVGGTQRNPQAPDVPSISEVLPGYSSASWTALVAPPETPKPVVQKLNSAVREIVRMPDVQKRLHDQGDQSYDLTPEQAEAFMREERGRWGKLVKEVGITVQ
jgi:tripartite-type tricarboxylate transporter receptor subunit TctC